MILNRSDAPSRVAKENNKRRLMTDEAPAAISKSSRLKGCSQKQGNVNSFVGMIIRVAAVGRL